jgi:hypothetical protein
MLAAAAAAIPAAVMPKTAAAGEQDPIGAAIEAHKAAMAEYLRLVSISSAIPFEDRAWHEADKETSVSCDLVRAAQLALLNTRPTTVAGAAAVLAYVASFWIEGDDSAEKGLPIYEPLARDDMLSAGEGFLPMIAAALRQLAVA